MHIPAELLNGALETCGAVFSASNLHALKRDKKVAGIMWQSWIVYTLWGIWDVTYVYPNLGLWVTEGIAIVRVLLGFAWTVYAACLSLPKK